MQPRSGGKGDGFLLMVRDMKSLTDIIVKQHPNLPIFLLGHSMGSFLSVRYVQLYANLLSGVIFSGTGGFDQVASSRAGARLARISMSIFGPKRKAYYIEKTTKKLFNKRIDKDIITYNIKSQGRVFAEKKMKMWVDNL